MDRFDPSDWTSTFVSSNRSFCMRTLQDTCGTIVDLVRSGQYEPAVAGLDRLINGMILMQNYASCNYSSHICFCSWAEAELVAFGITSSPEDKRREVALKLYEDARDFAQNENTRSTISAVIRDLRSRKPLTAVQQTHDPNFPGSILSILEAVRGKLAPGTHAPSQRSRPSTAQPAASEKSGWKTLSIVLMILLALCLAFILWRLFTRPKEATSGSPEPIQTTQAPQPETTDAPTEVPTEAPPAAYVVKTESGNGLNLREGPSTDAAILTAMEEGSVVTILEIRDNWAYVSIGDLMGWCSMDYLVPEDSVSAEPSEEAAVTATVTTKGGELRLRTEPNLDCDVIDGIPNGATVTVLRQEGEWSYVEYDGIQGWCASQYLTIP